MQLADGVRPDEVEWFLSASILHSNGDEIDIAVKDGRIVGVRGDRHSRVNRGRLGPKDLYGWQANSSADRLTRPLVREGGELREDYYALAMMVRAGVGTNHLDGNARLCTATSGEALKESFGCDGQPVSDSDN